jgi:hypothetical protein
VTRADAQRLIGGLVGELVATVGQPGCRGGSGRRTSLRPPGRLGATEPASRSDLGGGGAGACRRRWRGLPRRTGRTRDSRCPPTRPGTPATTAAPIPCSRGPASSSGRIDAQENERPKRTAQG